MDAKTVVLKAKELLSRMENASYLTRESFVTVCTSATKHFLKRVQRERQQRDVLGSLSRGGAGASGSVGPDGWSARDCALLSTIIEQEAAALVKRLGTPGKDLSTTPVVSATGARPRHNTSSSSEPPSFILANVSDDQIEGDAGQSAAPDPLMRGAADRFAVLPQCTVQAAAVVKKVLDDAYGAGRLRRSDYQQIVVAVVNHVLRQPGRLDSGEITSEDAERLRASATACLNECFARYAAELAVQNNDLAAGKRHHNHVHSDGPSSAPNNDPSARRSRSNDDQAAQQAAVSGALLAKHRPEVAGHADRSISGSGGLLDEGADSFEDQVAQLKKILHDSLDTAVSTTTLSNVSNNNASASAGTGDVAKSASSAAMEERRRKLLLELKSLHDEAGIVQAKMNIVLRELTELSS